MAQPQDANAHAHVTGNHADMDNYRDLLSIRPAKFDQHASNYHKANAEEQRCDECIHFFSRELDSYKVCEIVRPVPEEEILPEWTCAFSTVDGKTFPNYKGGQ